MQKVIFVAMESHCKAMEFCSDVLRALYAENIHVVRVTANRFRTEYTYVYFIDVYDPKFEQYLQGLRPDAIFGWRDLRERLSYRATDMTEYPECGLVEYIVKIHRGHEFLNKTLIMVGRRNGKTLATLECMKKIMLNSVYGKPMYEPKLTPLYNKEAWEIQQEVYQYLMNDIEITKECAEKMWPKTNPYLPAETQLIFRNGRLMTVKTREFIPEIKNVIFNDPATIVFWDDGTKTVVKCQEGDTYDPEKGLAMAISKRMLGNKYDYYHTFKHWLKKCDI